MIRHIDMNDISDGKLYSSDDMVKADCGGCVDCSACCQGMGDSIVLDPLDVHQLMSNLGLSFEELMTEYIELHVVDGLVLPNLRMPSGASHSCAFLNEQGRCNIHSFRPGICRLFPLGRYYTEDGHQYFLQVHECTKENRTKIKVKKWLGIRTLKQYEDYINQWHNFTRNLGQELKASEDEAHIKKAGMLMLQYFYVKPYGEDFFREFQTRLESLTKA